MATGRDILRAVQDYQRPLHDPTKTFTKERQLVIEGVTLTIETTELVVNQDDPAARKELRETLSAFIDPTLQVKPEDT